LTAPTRHSALVPALGLIGLIVAAGSTVAGGTGSRTTPAASSLPPRWWESAPAIARVGARGKEGPGFPLERSRAAAALDKLRKAGIGAIEVFAPAYGGKSFGGLDTIDRYRVDPALGTMEEFRGLIELAHARGMAVIAFDNLGYSSVEAVDFLKACDDVRAGRASKEAAFYLWSDRADAPAPGRQAGNTFFMVRPTHLPGGKPGTFYDSTKHEFWAWSERAGADFPIAPDTTVLLELKRQHPALQQLSTRRQIPTDADNKYYAFLRTAADRSQRILVVMNFQNGTANATLDLSGFDANHLTNLRTSATVPLQTKLSVEVRAYGFELFLVH